MAPVALYANSSATRRRLAEEGHFDPPADDLATFRAALAAHEPAAATFRQASDDPATSAAAFRRAEARYEETQAALFHAVEELTCVPARRLLKALGG
jgi:cytochrome c1